MKIRKFKTSAAAAAIGLLVLAGAADCAGAASASRAHPRRSPAVSHGTGWADLVDDSGSGAGFYPLPKPYRTGALRERQNPPIEYYAENPIRSAIAADAIETDYDEGYAFGHSHSVFDPDDGYGTPFFAGYYN